MADFDSSLPVRTQTAGDVAAKIVDGTVTTQALGVDSSGRITIKLEDGSGNAISSTTGSLNVEVTNATLAVTQSGSWTVTADQGTTPWVENLSQVGGASIALGQTTMSASLPVALASDQSDLPINLVKLGGTTPSASNALAIQISTGSSYVSSSNPLPVTIDPAAAGTAVNDYKDASAIAAGSSDNHDYTVTAGKTLHLEAIRATASGKSKMVIEIETGVSTSVFTTVGASFNSTATPNMVFEFPSEIQVAAGVRVRVVMSNRDLSAEDLYSTIQGFEI